MVVYKETANIFGSRVEMYLNISARSPPPAFLFPISTMSKTEIAPPSGTRISFTKRRLNRPERQPYLVIEESGAYTA